MDRIGRYEIRAELGGGAFGVVYRAWDPAVSREVAVKLMRRPDSDDALKEARAAGRLTHSNVVTVHDVGLSDAGPFIVMELVPGESVKAMTGRGPIPFDRTLQILERVAEALDYAHAQKVIHRDVKPANILVAGPQVKLADFGIARIEDTQYYRHSNLIGTLRYMAPELFLGQDHRADPLTDQYALAVTAYEMLTARPLFEGDSTGAIMFQIIYAPRPDPLTIGLPPQPAAILLRALSRNRQDRFPSCAAFVQALSEANTAAHKPQPVVIPGALQPGQSVGRYQLVSVSGEAQAPLDNSRWADRYQLVATISTTMIGEVYWAIERHSGREVCLSTLRGHSDPERFRTDCDRLATLRHPHLASLFHADTQADPYFWVSEKVVGYSLWRFMARFQPIYEPAAIDLVGSILEALDYGHSRGIPHADMRPGSIVIHRQGARLVPKLFNYGISFGDRNPQGKFLFTGAEIYLGPEVQDNKATVESNVYSAGQLLWELLLGRTAFAERFLNPNYAPVLARMQQRLAKLECGASLRIADGPQTVNPQTQKLIAACTHPFAAARPTARMAATELRRILGEPREGEVAGPINLGFDMPEENGHIVGWGDGAGFVHGVSRGYDLRLIRRGESGLCACLSGRDRPTGEFGAVMQRCRATPLAGRRVRFAAAVATRIVTGFGGLWLRIDGADDELVLDNMRERPIRGVTEWTSYSIEADVPPAALYINYGALLVGSGELSIDHGTLSVQQEGAEWRSLEIWRDPTS